VTTIVVGIEDSFRAADAVALVRDLAHATEPEILAVCAYPFDDHALCTLAVRDELCLEAEGILDHLCEPLNEFAVRQLAVADPDPARALLRAAEESDAWLIVVGSSRGEFTGRVRPGRTGAKLLESAPCAVALAPQGYRMRPPLAACGKLLIDSAA